MKKWNNESLEWIHKVREENYSETKDKTPREVLDLMREKTDGVVKNLGLKIIPAYEFSRGKSIGSKD